jgi:hypothetical protein
VERIRIEVIDRRYAAILAAKTPAERVAMVAAAHRMARILAESGARHLHPDWSEGEIQYDVARRMGQKATLPLLVCAGETGFARRKS